jgi:hypothetical protein
VEDGKARERPRRVDPVTVALGDGDPAGQHASAGGRPGLAAVVLNYNYGQYIREAVDSLLAQDTPFDEILVVDDGSTDDSAAVLDALPEIVRVIRKENGGQLSAAVAALPLIWSEYVYFLDADDRALPHLVTQVSGVLPSGPVKVQFPLQAVTGELEPTGSVFPTFPAGYDSAGMRQDNAVLGFYVCPPTSGNVYRRENLVKLPLSELDQRDFIDGPPTLVQPYLGAVVSLPAPLAQYRLHDRNHSSWPRPTVEQLESEISWFTRRWHEASAVLGVDAPFQPSRAPAYVLERELMARALAGRPVRRSAVALVRRMAGSGLPAVHKLALSVWALSLVLPSASWRRSAVDRRRSPAERSRVLRTAVSAARRIHLRLSGGRASGQQDPEQAQRR